MGRRDIIRAKVRESTREKLDKLRQACYTGGMRIRLLQLLTLPALLQQAVAEVQQSKALSEWDVEGMYVQARAILEDRSIQNVSGVPLMLETCVREGHPEAARLLLDVYEGKFKGLEANPQQATHLARSLAEAEQLDKPGSGRAAMRTEAMFRLALYLEKGLGCAADKTEAYKWMHQAASRGMPEARVEEARYLLSGSGVKQAPQQAWALLYDQAQKAPETPHLFFYMGHMCYQGIGVPRNARKAFELYRMGAMLNDAQCLNNLGAMFEKGFPTPRDPENALRLYRKAANLGNRDASANMQRLAFMEGVRASHTSATPPRKRIDNATLHLIQALPVEEATRERLRAWLMLSPNEEE